MPLLRVLLALIADMSTKMGIRVAKLSLPSDTFGFDSSALFSDDNELFEGRLSDFGCSTILDTNGMPGEGVDDIG
jgi:hypothetical protein